MPELPEVEAARRLAETHAKGKIVTKVIAADDDKVIQDITPRDLEKQLEGRRLVATNRKGKHLWLDFDEGPSLMFHFGMTGSFVVHGVAAAQYRTFVVGDEEWPPKFWKLQIEFDGGGDGGVQLAFADSRRFGRLRLQEDPTSCKSISELGFDPILSMPTLDDFTEMLKKQRRGLKALLLDQSFSAGVGNWVADEVLYQAKLHPEEKANLLEPDEAKALHTHLHGVLETAVKEDADSTKFPATWLFHQKWDGPKKAPKLDGNKIEFATIAGRTTAYVPAVQKLRHPTVKLAAKKKAAPSKKAAAESSDSSEDEDEEEAEEPDVPKKGGAKQKTAPAKAPKGKGRGTKQEAGGDVLKAASSSARGGKKPAKPGAAEVTAEKGTKEAVAKPPGRKGGKGRAEHGSGVGEESGAAKGGSGDSKVAGVKAGPGKRRGGAAGAAPVKAKKQKS